jgi:Fanconi anemia group I protein
VEPLPHLIQCIYHCLHCFLEENKAADNSEGSSYAQLLQTCEDLQERLLKSELDDFGLDKTAEYSLSSPLGHRNQLMAHLLIGTFEVSKVLICLCSRRRIYSFAPYIDLNGVDPSRGGFC